MNQIIPTGYSLTGLRVVMGLIFISHGAARLYYWSIPDFGNFLNDKGLIIGLPLAWIITIGEIISGSFLAVGYKVRYCVVFHVIIIVAGIFMVHFRDGWFVVGHGSGGVEYSVLILAVLLLIFTSYPEKK